MRTIWKYSVSITSEGLVHRIPKGAKFLSVQVQQGLPYMWFLLEDAALREDRKFFVLETGKELPRSLLGVSEYLGTVLLENGNHVLHLFEILDPARALLKATGW